MNEKQLSLSLDLQVPSKAELSWAELMCRTCDVTWHDWQTDRHPIDKWSTVTVIKHKSRRGDLSLQPSVSRRSWGLTQWEAPIPFTQIHTSTNEWSKTTNTPHTHVTCKHTLLCGVQYVAQLSDITRTVLEKLDRLIPASWQNDVYWTLILVCSLFFVQTWQCYVMFFFSVYFVPLLLARIATPHTWAASMTLHETAWECDCVSGVSS